MKMEVVLPVTGIRLRVRMLDLADLSLMGAMPTPDELESRSAAPFWRLARAILADVESLLALEEFIGLGSWPYNDIAALDDVIFGQRLPPKPEPAPWEEESDLDANTS